jgi:hypothetical protein
LRALARLFLRTQGCPRPQATSTRTWSHRPCGRPEHRTSSRASLVCGRETSLCSQLKAVAERWVPPHRFRGAGDARAASCSGLRHGEDRPEGTSQRPYPLSSSAAVPECIAEIHCCISALPFPAPPCGGEGEGLGSAGQSKVFLHRRIRGVHLPLPAVNARSFHGFMFPFEALH